MEVEPVVVRVTRPDCRRLGGSKTRAAAATWRSLKAVAGHPQHDWWDHALSFLNVPHRYLQGSAQVTDARLAELERRLGGRLDTLDSGLARLHGDVALLLPR